MPGGAGVSVQAHRGAVLYFTPCSVTGILCSGSVPWGASVVPVRGEVILQLTPCSVTALSNSVPGGASVCAGLPGSGTSFPTPCSVTGNYRVVLCLGELVSVCRLTWERYFISDSEECDM